MGINIVKYGETELINLTKDTVTENTLLSGIKAHDKAGNQITGLYVPPTIPSDYAGPVEVEPNTNTQTLYTAGKKVNSDITVKPIPSGYVQLSELSLGYENYYYGTIVGTGQTLSACTIPLEFSPECIIVKARDAIVRTNTSYILDTSFRVVSEKDGIIT